MLTVEDLCRRHGVQLRFHAAGARGRELCGPCPLCGGDDRFTVFPDQNNGAGSFWCRNEHCGLAGDVIDFLRRVEGKSFAEACREAGRDPEPPAQRLLPKPPRREGKECAITASPSRPAEVSTAPDAAAWLAQARHFVQTRHAALMGNGEALSWLAARGLDSLAVRRFRLGWQEGERGRGCIMRVRSAWGLAEGAPRRPGEAPRRGLWIPRGWVIPLLGSGGDPLRIRIRRTEEDRRQGMEKLKYYVLPGSDMRPLFVMPEGGVFAKPLFFVVVESELDAMLVWRAAGDIAGAVGAGTAKIRSLPKPAMKALEEAALILVATDSDDAGDKGFEAWQATFPQAVRLRCPAKDPGEMFPAMGWEGIRRWIIGALPGLYARKAEAASWPPEPPARKEPQRPEPASPPSPPAPEAKSPPAQKRPPSPAQPWTGFGLDGEYVGASLVMKALQSRGLGVAARRGDIVITGQERLNRRDRGLLMGFLKRHSVELDEIARRLNGNDE